MKGWTLVFMETQRKKKCFMHEYHLAEVKLHEIDITWQVD